MAMIVRIVVFFIAADILSFVNITITFDNFIDKNKDPHFLSGSLNNMSDFYYMSSLSMFWSKASFVPYLRIRS